MSEGHRMLTSRLSCTLIAKEKKNHISSSQVKLERFNFSELSKNAISSRNTDSLHVWTVGLIKSSIIHIYILTKSAHLKGKVNQRIEGFLDYVL